ncbi:hypothetical protein ANN_00773, partial [Periplaneta americana]
MAGLCEGGNKLLGSLKVVSKKFGNPPAVTKERNTAIQTEFVPVITILTARVMFIFLSVKKKPNNGLRECERVWGLEGINPGVETEAEEIFSQSRISAPAETSRVNP